MVVLFLLLVEPMSLRVEATELFLENPLDLFAVKRSYQLKLHIYDVVCERLDEGLGLEFQQNEVLAFLGTFDAKFTFVETELVDLAQS